MAERDGLHQDVAERGAFGRAGEHGNFQRVGGELIERHVLAAAADDVQPLDFFADEPFEPAQRRRGKTARGFRKCSACTRRGWPARAGRFPRQKSAIFFGMSSGLKKRGSSGLMSETNGGAAAASFSSAAKSYFFPSFAQCRRHSCTIQRPTMFLSRRTESPKPISLVKPSVAALVVDDGLRPFDAHERPGAGTQVGPVLAARRARRRPPRRCRASNWR